MNSRRDVVEREETRPTNPDSAIRWMLRGMMVGILLIGSANALSFFFRSDGWGSLLGSREPYDEAIGFPLAVWEEAVSYSSHTISYWAFAIDAATGIVLGLIIGTVLLTKRELLNRIIENTITENSEANVPMQFSISGLLITTALAALSSTIVRSFTPRVEILAAIYAAGPLVLVGLMFLPRGLRWQQRVSLLVPSTIILIAIAIALGSALDIEFDKVMMGIFICWTPQTTFAAILLTAWLLITQYRALPELDTSNM